jgi:hypothetical protein
MASTLTKLGAVNLMLEAIWEAPVASLEVAGLAQVATAKRILDQTSESVQSRPWGFNTEEDYTLVRDVNGKIPLPSNTLKVDADDTDVQVVMRGGYLYDKENHTLLFDEDVDVTITFLLEFEELPPPARRYVALVAARTFAAKWQNQSEPGQPTTEEIEALRNVESMEADEGDFNVFTGTWNVARILQR